MASNYSRSPTKFMIAGLFTALVFISTMGFSIYVPSTAGFFNIGESIIFLAALLYGPMVGAFAGGVGAAIADMYLGYPHYAPATLIVKACEGYVVGKLKSLNPTFKSKQRWRLFTSTLGVIIGFLIGLIGSLFYSGESLIFLFESEFSFNIPVAFWLVIAVIVALSILTVGFLSEPEFGWTVFSVVMGGFTMVIGYFVYQIFLIGPLFNIQVIAIAEIPINVGQMVIGAIIALPISRTLWRTVPSLKKT